MDNHKFNFIISKIIEESLDDNDFIKNIVYDNNTELDDRYICIEYILKKYNYKDVKNSLEKEHDGNCQKKPYMCERCYSESFL